MGVGYTIYRVARMIPALFFPPAIIPDLLLP